MNDARIVAGRDDATEIASIAWNDLSSITPSDVDDGSFDPDSDDTITLSLDHCGPFGLGSHTVTLTATDNHGATNASTAIVMVVDQTLPVIIGAEVDKPTLWPPNHKMVDVQVSYTAGDNCGPVDTQLNVSSNEPVNGTGKDQVTAVAVSTRSLSAPRTVSVTSQLGH